MSFDDDVYTYCLPEVVAEEVDDLLTIGDVSEDISMPELSFVE